MAQPFFPVPLEKMGARIESVDFRAGDSFSLGNGSIRVRTTPLTHPDGAPAYRLDFGGKSLCYVTDPEHVPGKTDQHGPGTIAGTDLVFYTTTYPDAEYKNDPVK